MFTVWPAVRSDSELAAYYQRVKAMKGSDPAKTATARLLATIIYQVLKQRGPYYPGKGLGPRPPSLCPGGPR